MTNNNPKRYNVTFNHTTEKRYIRRIEALATVKGINKKTVIMIAINDYFEKNGLKDNASVVAGQLKGE